MGRRSLLDKLGGKGGRQQLSAKAKTEHDWQSFKVRGCGGEGGRRGERYLCRFQLLSSFARCEEQLRFTPQAEHDWQSFKWAGVGTYPSPPLSYRPCLPYYTPPSQSYHGVG